MKPIRLLLLTLLFSANLNSQVFYDTVSVRSVGPGMMHYLVKAPAVPWNINILTVDLTNPSIGFESVKANDRLLGYETVRSMAARKSSPGHLPVGAINADFYSSGGVPTNIQIAQGEILIKPVSRPALGFAADNSPMIDVVAMAITASLDDTVITVHGVNATRATDQLILFNSYKGLTTGTNQYGREVMIRPISPWLANDTVVCVAESVEVSVGDIEIPQGWGILSGHGASDTISLSRIQKGDTVRLYQGIAPGPSQLKEMVGGNPVLVAGGIDVSPAAPREPRTAAGFSADSTMLYLVTVDGRQVGLSAGMTFVELAQFMIQIGVAEGVNLDGGGSTTMVIRDSVMNSPSDGTERSVSNGLLVISSAPAGSLSNITLSPKKSRIFRGDSRQFLALGVDEYGNPASFDPAQVRFSCDLQIGSIDSLTGVFISTDSTALGFVKLQYGAWSDSAQVVVKLLGSLNLSLLNIVTDTVRTISFNVSSFDIDNVPRQFEMDAYQWSSTHPEVGLVSSSGVFSGVAEGTTEVIASLDGVSDTAAVRVEVGVGSIVLDSLESLSAWVVSAVQVDSFFVTPVDSVTTLGTHALRVDYGFTASGTVTSYLYLDTDIPLYGVADSVLIDARTDHHSHRIYYVVEDDNGEQFRLYSSKLLNKIGVPDTIRTHILSNQAITAGAVFNYPIVLKRIEIQLVYNRQAGVSYNGTLFLDNLRATYPKKLTTIEVLDDIVPGEFRLNQNFPNPFNSETNVEFSLTERSEVTLRVYDLLGREVKRLADEQLPAGNYRVRFEASRLASGPYFIVLEAQGKRLSRKMLYLK